MTQTTTLDRRRAIMEALSAQCDGTMWLIDGPEDGVIEEQAWVQVTEATPDPAAAIRYLEKYLPSDDLEEGETYRVPVTPPALQRSWHRPDADDEAWERFQYDWSPWSACKSDDEGAVEFWNIEVVVDE